MSLIYFNQRFLVSFIRDRFDHHLITRNQHEHVDLIGFLNAKYIFSDLTTVDIISTS